MINYMVRDRGSLSVEGQTGKKKKWLRFRIGCIIYCADLGFSSMRFLKAEGQF